MKKEIASYGLSAGTPVWKTCWSQRPAALLLIAMLMTAVMVSAQDFNQPVGGDELSGPNSPMGNNNTFNPHRNDSTGASKEIPRGMTTWTVDRRFGDIIPAVIDTMPHLYMNSIFNTGLHHEYNSTGNNYTARLNRIFIDRAETSQFMFTDPYDYVYKAPDQLHFTNTLSPLTNLSYDNCGDKQNGEDHFEAKFAVNANKRLGFGFDVNYAYARGYFSDQSTSHFGATLYTSYLGDQYQMHLMGSTWHQKAAENGGVTNDEYVTHPEASTEDYSENEIPTVLSQNWNRNDHLHLFLTHRYSLGFYKSVEMTDAEKKARKFASASKKENADKKLKKKKNGDDEPEQPLPAGRPDDAKIADESPTLPADSLAVAAERIKVDTQEKMDSLLAQSGNNQAETDSTKQVFVPVTSFIHTLETNKHTRIYQAYATPQNYYGNTYILGGRDENGMSRDSIYDESRMLQIKNTFAVALMEGFNKYAKAGLKGFVTHELRQFRQPAIEGDSLSYLERTTEHNVSVGGKLAKTEGNVLHYSAVAEAWLVGKDVGQLKIDATADVNIPLLGDTVQVAAKGYFHRLNPTFFQRHLHSKHFWWDDDDMSMETRTRIEGMLSFRKTRTRLRAAIEEMQNYTYFGMNYDYQAQATNDFAPIGLTASVNQNKSNINVMTAQLMQDFELGPLHFDNIVTVQKSSDTDVLPLPSVNIYSNLYLKFKIAKQLLVELGGDLCYFTKYYAPDFCPQINQFAVQENEASRVELGGYPFVNVYANMHLKRARFFIMMSNATSGMANRMAFLAPHYPTNSNILRLGVSWNFYN